MVSRGLHFSVIVKQELLTGKFNFFCHANNIQTWYFRLKWSIGKWIECLPMVCETGVQSQVEFYQKLKNRYLMPPCLELSTIRWRSRVKWSNPGNIEAPSPIPWCSSYLKVSLRVAVNWGRQLYLLYFQEARLANRLYVEETDSLTQSQIPNKVVCVWLLRKSMSLSMTPARGK